MKLSKGAATSTDISVGACRKTEAKRWNYPLPLALLIGGTCLSLASYACSGAGTSNPRDDPSPGSGVHDKEEGARFPTSQLDSLRQNLSDSQRAILADGFVTSSEYEGSVAKTVACLRDAGLEIVDGPRRQKGGKFITFGYSAGSIPDPGGTRVRDTYQRCYREFEDAVDHVWAYQNRPTQEAVLAAREALITCLRAANVNVAIDADPAELFNLSQGSDREVHLCLTSTEDRFGVTGIGRYPAWPGLYAGNDLARGRCDHSPRVALYPCAG